MKARYTSRFTAILTSLLFAFLLVSFLSPTAQAQVERITEDIRVIHSTKHDVSEPLRDVDVSKLAPMRRGGEEEGYIIENEPPPSGGAGQQPAGFVDPVRQRNQGTLNAPPVLQNFDGLGNGDNFDVLGGRVDPPDPVMEVGEDYIVEQVNIVTAVYDKTGNLVMDPVPNNAFWSGFGGACENNNNGDAIVLYDQAENRWIISQFANPIEADASQCVAISQTSDPTGSYYRYEFPTPGNDYPKSGVGTEAYYLSWRDFSTSGGTMSAGAVNKEALLNGEDAEIIAFGPDNFGTRPPADIDGALPPADTPHPFPALDGSDGVSIFGFDPDFETPSNSTFEELATISVESFNSEFCAASREACIPQPNGPDLEVLESTLMHRVNVRDFGDHMSMVANHTVNVGDGRAGIRWYEFRNDGSGWSLQQQGTYAPEDGQNRWMGSIALGPEGGIALGYSVSSEEVAPSVRFTGRPAGAAPGQMTFEETEIFAGEASKDVPSTFSQCCRWGDYTAMVTDAGNPGTFWYVGEYGAEAPEPNWDTRIASFQFDTDDETAPLAVDDLSASSASVSEVDLSWTAPSDPPDGSSVAGYDIRYSADPIENDTDFENASQVTNPPVASDPGTTESFTVTGLSQNTEYYFAIKSTDAAGNRSDLSNVPSATTDPAPLISVDPESFDVAINKQETEQTEETLTISNVGPEGAAALEWSATVGSNVPADMPGPSSVAATAPSTTNSSGIGADLATAASESYSGEPTTVGNQQASTYQLDDGTSENALGFNSTDFDIMWINAFEVAEGAGTVNQISTIWGNEGSTDVPPEGKEATALIYNDPNNDGDPTDAELVRETTITVQDPGTDNFTTTSITPTPVDGTFFIAVLIQNNASGNYPAPLDESSEYQEASWVAAETDNPGTFDKEDLTNNTNPPTLLGDAGFPANFMVRAEGTAGFLSLSPKNGSVEQGSDQNVTATFDASAFDPGVYEASINLTSNDPEQPVTSVSSTLEITDGPPAIATDPGEYDFGDVFTGTSSEATITVTNTGGTALQVSDVSLSGNEAFTLLDSDDADGFALEYEESRDIEVKFSPTESGSASATLEFSTEQEVSASTSIQGQGAPFITFAQESLEQTLDLTSGDTTATQEFKITNEFSESLPFSVVIEALETSNTVELSPKLTDENLRRLRSLNERGPQSNTGDAPATTAFQNSNGNSSSSPLNRLLGNSVLDEVGVTGYANDVVATESIVSFDLGVPSALTIVDEGVDSYAGTFVPGNNEQIYWVDNTDNGLKTYTLEDGSVETIGTLDFEQGDLTAVEMATDPTTRTTYVVAGGDPGDFLFEVDPETAELTTVGELSEGCLLAIDDTGQGYCHDIANDQILTVDLQTAEQEVVGPTGIDASFAQSMTYDQETGELLMAAFKGLVGTPSELRRVDRETGSTELIGPIGPAADLNEIGWFTTPGTGIPWLTTNLSQGTIPAGATLTLEAQFDASEVVEGEQEAQISIVGEELQGKPSESLPVSLTVEAEPVVFLSKDELGFEQTFVNDETTAQLVTLRNDGQADMNINEVSLDNENFEVTPTSIEDPLKPGESQIFEVTFTPQDVGEFNATLSFSGDEVSGEVTLTGEGIPAPELALTPESFEKQAYLGQTQEETMEFSNEGGNPLEYDITELPSQPPAEDVFVDEDFSGDPFPPEEWSRAGANDGENWGTDCFGGPDEILPAASFCWSPSFVGTSRLITPQLDTGGQERVIVEFTHLIDNYSGPEGYELRLETSGDGGETWTTVNTWEPQDLPVSEEMFMIQNEDVGSSEFHVAWTFEGDSFQINDWAVGEAKVFVEGDWLAVEPGSDLSGTLEPGSSQELTLNVDAGVPGLEEGTFESGLNFATNDPLAESAELPFTLNVIENLSVAPNPTKEEVYPNQAFGVDIGVESLNDLEVYSYEMTMDYDPEKVHMTEVDAEGTLSEGISVSTNIDNEEGTLTIAAAESGVSAPDVNNAGSQQPLFDLTGEGTLISVKAKAQTPSFEDGENVDVNMDITNMVFNEGEPPASPKDGTIPMKPLYGDTDLNLTLTAMDADMVLQYTVGSTELGATAKTHADVSGNGEIGAFDASLILRRTVGDISCFPVESSCDESEPVLAGKSSESSGEGGQFRDIFAWGKPTQLESSSKSSGEGTALALPLKIDKRVWNASYGSIRALEVETELDPDKVSVKDLKTQLPDDWRANYHVSDGKLRVVMAGSTPLSKVGKVASLTLQRKDAESKLEVGGSVAINEGSGHELDTQEVVTVPDEFALEGTYPNPFRQSATLKMDLPSKATVSVEVYDLLGRKVTTAYTGEKSAGKGRTVQIDGTNLSSGTYFYRARVELENGTRTKSGKMTVVQ